MNALTLVDVGSDSMPPAGTPGPADRSAVAAAERAEAARIWLATRATDGTELTGRQLAELVDGDKSARWARNVIAEVRAELVDDEAAADGMPCSIDLPAGAPRASAPGTDGMATTPAAGQRHAAGTRSPATVAGLHATRPVRMGWAARLTAWVDRHTVRVVTFAVAAVAAAASYGHMLHVALLAGEPIWIARGWPITVDGLVYVALRAGRAGRWWLGLGLAVSIAANVLVRYPEFVQQPIVSALIAAFPPIALWGCHSLRTDRGASI